MSRPRFEVLLIGVFAAILIGAGLAGPKPVIAATSKITLCEDTYWEGDCGTFWHVHGGYNLDGFSTGLSGTCHSSAVVEYHDWEDCASSWIATINGGECVRLTENKYGGGSVLWTIRNTAIGPNTYSIVVPPAGANDTASSIQWGHENQNSICVWSSDFVP